MVSRHHFESLFRNTDYVASEFDSDKYDNFKILPLHKEGAKRSLERMADVLLADYYPGLEALLSVSQVKVPNLPTNFSGWYPEMPTSKVLLFDIETMVQMGNFPVMAVAIDPNGEVFVWKYTNYGELIELPDETLVIAHNSSFDAQGLANSFQGIEHGCYFMDTMTLANACYGYCSSQFWVADKKETGQRLPIWAYKGYGKSNFKSLKDTYFHLYPDAPDEDINKEIRDMFVTAKTLDEIEFHLGDLLEYNINDVVITLKVFRKLFPYWKRKNPSSVTLMGHIISSSYRIPLTPDWETWIEKVEATHAGIENQITSSLAKIAKKWASEGQDPDNPWQSHLDWSVVRKKLSKKRYELLSELIHPHNVASFLDASYDDQKQLISSLSLDSKSHFLKNWKAKGKNPSILELIQPYRGEVTWYKKALKSPNGITLKSKLAHYLLEMQFDGKPVFHTADKGWQNSEKQVPHPSGGGNVGYLFSDKLGSMFENGMLSSENPVCKEVLDLAVGQTYWVSVRKRVNDARVINNWTLPQTGGGTVTGRVTDPLWLTTCDPKPHLVGSELKSRIQCPEGYKFLNADFSGQEMRIAWTLGDSLSGYMGATEMSRSGIMGNKADGTDSHSSLAAKLSELVGRPYKRGDAKVIGFSMLYMAGKPAVASYIRMACPEVDTATATRIANGALEYRRGKTMYTPEGRVYEGGTDSQAYNAINQICNQDFPRTPLLQREMSDPMCPRFVKDDFYTTRANWVVQGSARDELDCVSVAMTFMFRYAGLKSRLVWSRHDEVIVMCPESEVKLASEILQQAHTFTWAAFHECLGLYDIPTQGLLFDAIDVDTTVRKEPDVALTTPSNQNDPHPNGYSLYPEDFKGFESWSELRTLE